MPALVVVAAVDDDMTTPIIDGFPAVINDYVESVHVQPRPFTEVAQSNVIGERFVLQLMDEGRISRDDAEAILGRMPDVTGKASVRAATLVHAVCDVRNDAIVRKFAITEQGAKLTKLKRARLVAPLVLRQFTTPDPTAERALMRAFTPDLLLNTWTVTGDDSSTLRARCLDDIAAGDAETAAIAELMARGGPALCASGLLLGDQESTVKGHSALRGNVDKVVEALSKTAGGINVLADAVAWADGERAERPRQFDIAGHVKHDDRGDVLHFTTAWQIGNMGVRALAFTDGEIPAPVKGGHGMKTPNATPEQLFSASEDVLIESLMRAQSGLLDMLAVRDEQGRQLIKVAGLRKAKIYQQFPRQMSTAYARFGKDDELMAIAFPEDDLPAKPELDDNHGEDDE
jgi:hypothetical protein